ncbi:MAG: outer membrane lipoprotein-sorting protein [Candidatus Bipolaricaulota bacterium]|nr:outer membrane lipoprotein-sorting protein [Candidatus Bipolaricaulota bacterium]MDW8030959.1 outer membrane lipoprotein-sorting protein [Candidatus Bipolaricaulota bacterium]
MKRLTQYVLLAVLATAMMGIALVAQPAPTDDQLLEAFDKARFIEATSFTITVEIVADRPDGTKQAIVQLYFKEINGKRYARIEFLAPEELRGQVYLSTPEGTFFWQPGLATPLKVSGRQQVFGDSSVAETVGIQFKGDYKIKARKDVTLSGNKPGWEVELEATDKSVAFQRAVVTAEKATLRPVKARLFALSGDPLNDVTYQEYAALERDEYVKKQLIENQLIKANKTLLTITKIEAKDLPNDLFDPNKLGR